MSGRTAKHQVRSLKAAGKRLKRLKHGSITHTRTRECHHNPNLESLQSLITGDNASDQQVYRATERQRLNKPFSRSPPPSACRPPHSDRTTGRPRRQLLPSRADPQATPEPRQHVSGRGRPSGVVLRGGAAAGWRAGAGRSPGAERLRAGSSWRTRPGGGSSSGMLTESSDS